MSRRRREERADQGEEHRLTSCEGKIGYGSAGEAAKAVSKVLGRSRGAGSRRHRLNLVSIYYCGYCGKHHWGHPPKGKATEGRRWRG